MTKTSFIDDKWMHRVSLMAKFITRETIVDKATGEVLEEKATVVDTKKVKGSLFTQVYHEDLNPYLSVSGGSLKLFHCLMHLAEHKTNKIALTTETRIELCKLLKISNGGLRNCLNQLKEVGLISGKRSDYLLEPFYSWKGSTSERTKILNGRVTRPIK